MEELFELFYATTGVCTDTRRIEKDCLFICLKGTTFNGNTFASQAIQNGAQYAIVDEAQYKTNDRIYVVPNTLIFLQQLANYHRRKFRIPVIGITGSNGKTSTKELINCVLSEKFRVLATKGNLNNHIGVPLTLLELNAEHELAIIEMGANRFKDIEELCAIAEPNFGIITNIGKAHLEGFGGFEGVLKTKRELYESVELQSGTIVYNHDDQILIDQLPKNIRKTSYGTDENADVIGTLIGLNPFVKLSYRTSEYNSPVLETKMVGKYNFYNYLAAIAFGNLFGVEPEKINAAVTRYAPENNRSQVKRTARNTLILDCYNANPTSMRSALESFSLIEHPDKCFIIGDMLELGDQSDHEHKQILDFIERQELIGYTVGPLFQKHNSPNVLHSFHNREEAAQFLQQAHWNGKLILLKGSRGIGLENLEQYV
jgi:UDP-N-acetylmuramoyl-tripeptide--D-alanyl-D-alanine ligase